MTIKYWKQKNEPAICYLASGKKAITGGTHKTRRYYIHFYDLVYYCFTSILQTARGASKYKTFYSPVIELICELSKLNSRQKINPGVRV